MMARWLAPAERSVSLRLQLAVELVEIGRALQQRQRADAGEVAAQRISGAGRRGIDDEFAIGLAAIGAEIGNAELQHAAGQRRLDRGRREMRVADDQFGRGDPGLGVDIVQSGEIDRCIAPGLRRRRRRAIAPASATSSRWKSRSSFTSGLLARSTEAQPLKAPSPSVPVRPLIMTIEPLSRTSALADSGLCSRPGASSVRSTGMFCRSSGGAGAVALISNLSGCPPARALAGDRDVAIGRRSRHWR